MKYLQIHNTPNNEPRLLEMGVDFDTIIENYYFGVDTETVKNDKMYLSLAKRSSPEDFNTVAFIIDCYQSRPLIEIAGWCEFDVLSHYDGEGYLILIEFSGVRFYQNPYSDDQVHLAEYDYDRFNQHSKNIGSIFLPENRTKYPELYNQALKIIKK